MSNYTEQEEEILAWKYELRDILASKMEISPSGCWLWRASTDSKGYGRITFYPQINNKPAHVISYICFVEKHVTNQLDHQCEIKICVHPLHVLDVTSRVNNRRAKGWTLNEEGVWLCKRGHTIEGKNAYSRPKDPSKIMCLSCRKMTSIERKLWRSN